MLNFYARGNIITVEEFWDCNCVEDFINRKAHHRKCNVCGCEEEDSPDSRADEVLLYHEGLTFQEKQELIRAIKKGYWETGKGKHGDRKLKFSTSDWIK